VASVARVRSDVSVENGSEREHRVEASVGRIQVRLREQVLVGSRCRWGRAAMVKSGRTISRLPEEHFRYGMQHLQARASIPLSGTMQLTQDLVGGGAVKTKWLRYTSLVRTLFVFIRRCHQRRFRTFILRCSVRILILAAAAVIVSCAGVSTSTKTVTLPSTGASTHTVDLSWVASMSADVMGYNVYRAVYSDACGPLSKINTVLVATTSYTDSTVANGTSYCYATTAVDTSNRESGYSNVVADVQIPAS
jgi:hypothetical protein